MGSKSYPKEEIVIFANGKVGRIDNFVKAEIYETKKKTMKKIEQDKGFEDEYQSISKFILNNECLNSKIFEEYKESTRITIKLATS